MKLDRREHILFGLVLLVLLAAIFTSGIITGNFVDKEEQRGEPVADEKQAPAETVAGEEQTQQELTEQAVPETEQQAQDFGAMSANAYWIYFENGTSTAVGGSLWKGVMLGGYRFNDTDWNTNDYCWGPAGCAAYYYVNYTKPAFTVDNVYWQVKYGDFGPGFAQARNLTSIPSQCWSSSVIQLEVLSINQSVTSYSTEWWCRTSGGSWTQITSNSGASDYYMDVYEEGLFFYVEPNVTACTNLTKNDTIYTLGSDLSNTQSTGYCLLMNGLKNTTLDCQGKKLDSDDTSNHNYAIYVNNSKDITIKNCFVSDYVKAGIYLYKSNNTKILNTTVFSNNNDSSFEDGTGVQLSTGSNFTNISGCNISNNMNGIFVNTSSSINSTFFNNTIRQNCRMGVYLGGGYNKYNRFANNTIYQYCPSYSSTVIGLSSEISSIFENNLIYNVTDGISIQETAENNTFTNNSIAYVSGDYFSTAHYGGGTQRGNVFNNLMLNTTKVSFTYDAAHLHVTYATAPAGGDLAGNYSVGKYVDASLSSGTGWIFLNVSYTDTELGAVNESTIKMYKNTSGSWTSSLGTGTNGVDAANNRVYANITSFGSIFAPMGEQGSGGGVLGCTDLVVNDSVFTLSANLGTTKTGSDSCIIINGKSNITLDCNGYKITGNETLGCNYGIYIANSKDITIKDCFAQDYYGAGIVVLNSNNTLLFNTTSFSNYNVPLSTGRGIQLYSGANYTNITNCDISSNYWGLVLESSGSQNSTFNNNSVHDNTNYGIIALGGYNLYNTFIKNNIYNNAAYQVYLQGEDYAYLENNTISGSVGAIVLSGADNCTFKNNVIPTASQAIILYNSLGNEFTNITVNKTSFNFTYDKNLTIAPAAAPSGGGLAGYNNLGKYLSISNQSADSWIFINITYSNADLGYSKESSLRIFKNASGTWNQDLNATGTLVSGVNTADNYVYANISNFSSVFAPMAEDVGNSISACADITIGDATYILTDNITGNDTDGRCIDISADNVTLDCDGYYITGSDPKIDTVGIYAADIKNLTLIDCSISEYYRGVELSDVNDSTVENTAVYNNNDSDVKLSDSDDNNNEFINLTSNNVISSFMYIGDITLNSSAAPPAAAPPGYYDIDKYLDITNDSSDAWIYLNISYTDSDISALKESGIRIWKNAGGSWSQNLNASGALVSGVNTASNYVYANISNFGSIFGPMGLPSAFSMSVNSPSNTNYIGNSSHPIWFNVTTSSAASNCTMDIDGAANQTIQNSSSTKWFNQSYFTTIGEHNVTFNCNDTENEGATPIIVFFTIDWTAPIVNLTLPANSSTVTTEDVTIHATVNEPASTCKVDTDSDDNNTMTNSSGDWHETVALVNGNHNATVYCADIAGNWNVSQTVTFTVSVTETHNGGGGGTGTAGDTGIFSFTNIPAGVYRDVNSSNNVIDVILISLKVNNSITGQISVKQLITMPIGVSEPLDNVYKYFQFTSTNIPYSQILDGSIYFRISKAWITSNNIDTSSIVMYRYSNGWQTLSTEITGSDATYYYFKAKTTMFSYFVITGKAAAVIPQPVKNETPVIIPTPTAICGDGICDIAETSFLCPSDCKGPTEEQKQTGVNIFVIGGISAFALVVAGAVIFFVFIRPRLAGAAEEEMPMTTEVEITPEKEHMLEAYVRTSISGGHSQQDIVNALEKAGWTNEQVETAFELAMVPPQKEEALIEYVQNEFTKGYREEQISQKLINSGWNSKEARHAIKMAQKQFSKA